MAFSLFSGQRLGKFEYKPLSSNVKRDAREQTLRNCINKYGVLVAFFASFIMLCTSVALAYTVTSKTISDTKCAMQVSTYSPAFAAVEYIEYNIQNEQFGESEYRGHPTPEMDKKWAELWKVGAVDVPVDKIPQLNQTLSKGGAWRPSPKVKGNGVAAMLEVFHQIHCLDIIRRYTYIDTYYTVPSDFHHDPVIIRSHVDHCIEALRISLMCTSDVTLLLLELDNTERGEHANFNNHRKCRNYEKIREWNVQNTVVV